MTEYVVPSILMALGLVILTGGGEVLVRGASRLAVAARISPPVVGLTVVAYGTSSPELAVAIQASLAARLTSPSATLSAATSATSCWSWVCRPWLPRWSWPAN